MGFLDGIVPFNTKDEDEFTPEDSGVTPPLSSTLFPPGDDLPGRTLHCEIGGHDWQYMGTGTKRLPRNCADHKVRTGGTYTSRPTGSRKLEDLKRRLGVFVGSIGKGSSAMLPVTGTTLMTNAAKAADATVELCKDNARALEILEKLTLSVPALDLGEVVAATLVSVGVDTGRIQPDAMPAMLLGVSETFEAVHGAGSIALVQQQREQARQAMAEPPAFVPIS